MRKFGLGVRAFFRVFKDALFAEQLHQLLNAEPPQALDAPTLEVDLAPARSEALTLLAALQREARLVDFLMEGLEAYSDAQVGAAVRDVHRDSGALMQRLFGIEPLRPEAEGEGVSVPQGFVVANFRLTGNVAGEAPYQGVLRHSGWRATRCELPAWSGQDDVALTIAPAEVEVG